MRIIDVSEIKENERLVWSYMLILVWTSAIQVVYHRYTSKGETLTCSVMNYISYRLQEELYGRVPYKSYTGSPTELVGDQPSSIPGYTKDLLGAWALTSPGQVVLDLGVSEKKNRLGAYLAGLIEGDGSIIVPDPSIRNRQPLIRICFNEKDMPLAKVLIKEIGYGRLSFPKEGKYVLLEISEYAGLYKVIQLVNGYFRTPKLEALNRLVIWVNERSLVYLNKYAVYPKLTVQKGLDFSPIENNNWFAGFVDADGNFNTIIAPRANTNNVRIQTQFRLELRQNYHRSILDSGYGTTYFDILSKIANHLSVNVYSRSRFLNSSITYQYYFVAGSLRSKKILRSYFDMYPLYSSKFLDYKDWCSIIELTENLSVNRSIENKIEIINRAKDIKSGMNSLRKNFNWSHLKQFPCS